MTARRPLLVPLAVLVLVAALGACKSPQRVSVGEGDIPESVPDDFPIPAGATVGLSIVDREAHQTEFVLTVPQGVEEAAQYFLVNLVSSGYVVERSTGSDTRWDIRFSRDTLRGTFHIEEGGSAVSGVVVSINRS
ncbi:MAG TPA: hypothetical protein VLS92_00745 [Acidimicrobiia bacterium]|nr:hypothetical protein [Acidimicrobiia bacterium]